MNLDHLSNLTDDEFITAVKAHPSYYDHSPTANLLKESIRRFEAGQGEIEDARSRGCDECR